MKSCRAGYLLMCRTWRPRILTTDSTSVVECNGHSVRMAVELMGCRTIGLMGCRTIGLMGCRTIGLMGCRTIGLMGCRNKESEPPDSPLIYGLFYGPQTCVRGYILGTTTTRLELWQWTIGYWTVTMYFTEPLCSSELGTCTCDWQIVWVWLVL